MKLYTEEQVVRAMSITATNNPLTYLEVIETLVPIELPSDEEIEETFTFYPQMIEGAKWMRDKLTNTKEK